MRFCPKTIAVYGSPETSSADLTARVAVTLLSRTVSTKMLFVELRKDLLRNGSSSGQAIVVLRFTVTGSMFPNRSMKPLTNDSFQRHLAVAVRLFQRPQLPNPNRSGKRLCRPAREAESVAVAWGASESARN